ncbi:hypothetical protein QC763_0049910 [Podospora pseudopauciseta]|uniref:Uncharacterized protein n=1 Tax=Podospora pseudopauciseta TaxID=2093780 RepID=A0ABR0HFJ2_9PEZI|nr:hypothetical protein QC763_0049910 [Podospora pseudopauciseta]
MKVSLPLFVLIFTVSPIPELAGASFLADLGPRQLHCIQADVLLSGAFDPARSRQTY